MLHEAFPYLEREGYTETSPAASEYNCIAWAAGRTDFAWWPDPQGIGYWPADAPRVEAIEAFYRAFASVGYVPCEDGRLEVGVEKIALYALGGNQSTPHASYPMVAGPASSANSLTSRIALLGWKVRFTVRCMAL